MANEEGGARDGATVAHIGLRFVRGHTEDVVKDSTEILRVEKFETQPATVSRGYGFTFSMGNFEFVRVDVALTMPCYAEDVDAADVWAQQWVEKRIRDEMMSAEQDKIARTRTTQG